MAGETVCQTSETVNSLKPKLAWLSLLYRFRCIDYTRQINGRCLFSLKIQSAIVVVILTSLVSV